MSVVIPCDPKLVRYTEQVVLEGITYTFGFHWNSREDAWYMDIMRGDRTPIVSGVKVVVDFPLGLRTADPNRPPGMITAVDTTGQGKDPQRYDLGDRVQLLYFTKAELKAILD